jgi:hypothetical protein
MKGTGMEPHAGFEGLTLPPPVGLKNALLGVTEDITGPWTRFANALLTAGRIPPAMRELAILRTASRCESDYIIGPHRMIGRHLGLSAAEIALALAPAEPLVEIDPGSAAEVVIAAIDQMLAWGDVDDRIRAGLKRTVGGDHVTELAMLVGQYILVGLICKTSRLEPEPGGALE